jgi:hypothetical protein
VIPTTCESGAISGRTTVLKRPVWGFRRASRAELAPKNQSAPSSAAKEGGLKVGGIGVLIVTASVSWLSRMIRYGQPVPATTQIEPNAATGGEL